MAVWYSTVVLSLYYFVGLPKSLDILSSLNIVVFLNLLYIVCLGREGVYICLHCLLEVGGLVGFTT